jgi:hypothetical protein
MNETKEQINEVTFNLVSVLTLIGSDDSLLSLFEQKFTTDIKLMVTSAKKGVLDSETEKYVKNIFENVIMKRREYVDQYVRLLSKSAPKVKPTNESKSVRRYGKQMILADIEKQGGEPTEIQRMMLEVNDLKNIVAKLNRKGKAQMLEDAEVLTDKECREVIGVIRTLKNKLKKEKII